MLTWLSPTSGFLLMEKMNSNTHLLKVCTRSWVLLGYQPVYIASLLQHQNLARWLRSDDSFNVLYWYNETVAISSQKKLGPQLRVLGTWCNSTTAKRPAFRLVSNFYGLLPRLSTAKIGFADERRLYRPLLPFPQVIFFTGFHNLALSAYRSILYAAANTAWSLCLL